MRGPMMHCQPWVHLTLRASITSQKENTNGNCHPHSEATWLVVGDVFEPYHPVLSPSPNHYQPSLPQDDLSQYLGGLVVWLQAVNQPNQMAPARGRAERQPIVAAERRRTTS